MLSKIKRQWKVIVLVLFVALVGVVIALAYEGEPSCESRVKQEILNSKNALSKNGVIFPKDFEKGGYPDAYYEAYLKEMCK